MPQTPNKNPTQLNSLDLLYNLQSKRFGLLGVGFRFWGYSEGFRGFGPKDDNGLSINTSATSQESIITYRASTIEFSGLGI